MNFAGHYRQSRAQTAPAARIMPVHTHRHALQVEAQERITVICITYNSGGMVPQLQEALAGYRHVVVVDNGSRDDTAARLQRSLPHAQVIARQHNAGFGQANNEAMSLVTTDYALLLNPDCSIAPHDVQRLVDCMDAHGDAGIVAPQGWRSGCDPQKSCRPAFFRPQPAGHYRVPADVVQADWLHGSCQLVRTRAFRSIGGFDPAFFLYYEDDDLCLRMQRGGWRCLLQPAAHALHPGGVSSAPSARTTFLKQFHYARSRQIALRRYVGSRAALAHRSKLLAAAVPAFIFHGLLLQRQHASKWIGWGLAALCAVLELDSLAERIR